MEELFCSTCYERFNNGDNSRVLLTCLHSICLACLNDFKTLGKEEHTCKVCEERFAFDNINVVQETITKEGFAFCDDCKLLDREDEEVTNQHANHTFGEIIAKNKKNIIELNQRIPDIDKALQDLNALTTALRQRQTSITSEIETTFHDLIETAQYDDSIKVRLEARCNALKEEVKYLIKAEIKAIDLQLQTLQTAKDHIKLIEILHNSIDSSMPSMPGIVRTRIDTLQQISLSLKPLTFDSIRFLSNKASNEIERLGYISRSKFDRDWTMISQPSLVLGYYGTKNGEFDRASGVVQLQNGNLVVSDCFNERLQFFTSEGVFLRSIQVNHLVDNLTVTPNDELLMASTTSNLLLHVSLQTEGAAGWRETQQPAYVSVLANGLVVACCHDHNIRAFSSDRTLQWTASIDCTGCPGGLAALGDDELVVCDYRNNRLQILSVVDGHFIRFIGADQLDSPNAVAFIPGSDMLVVAQNYKITILRLDGSLVHEWGSFGSQPGQLNWARSVAILQNGQIAVADYNNDRVQIF